MEKVTHDNLPQAVEEINLQVQYLVELLKPITNTTKSEQPAIWFNIDELRAYLPDKPKKSTVYDWTRNRTIPFHKPKKSLAFLKAEIDEWLKSGKVKTHDEFKLDVEEHELKRKSKIARQ